MHAFGSLDRERGKRQRQTMAFLYGTFHVSRWAPCNKASFGCRDEPLRKGERSEITRISWVILNCWVRRAPAIRYDSCILFIWSEVLRYRNIKMLPTATGEFPAHRLVEGELESRGVAFTVNEGEIKMHRYPEYYRGVIPDGAGSNNERSHCSGQRETS